MSPSTGITVRIPKSRHKQFYEIRKRLTENNFLKKDDSENAINSEVIRVLLDSFFRRDYYRVERKVAENTEELKKLIIIIEKMQTILLLILTNSNKLDIIDNFKERLDEIIALHKS